MPFARGNRLRRSVVLCCVLVFSAVAAQAQGPGFPNVPRTKGQLISGPLLTSIGRTAVLAYQQGLVVVNPEAPESAPGSDLVSRSLDISNPAAPVATAIPFLQPNSWIAAHGYWQEGVYLRGLSGGDVTVELVGGVPRVVQRNAPDPPQFPPPVQGVPFPGRGLLFQPFHTQSWTTYQGTTHSNVLYRGAQQLAVWDHIGQTGVIGQPFLLGNILYVASDQANSGIAAYDITPSLVSPGTQPQLLGLLTANLGGYWPEIWGGGGKLYIMFPGRVNGHFQVADVTDPTAMRVVADRYLGAGDPSYIQFQDNFAFMDRYKIDMRNDFAVDLALDADGHQIDVSQFALPLGNLLVTGGYTHSGRTQGVAIWAHQAAPDTTGPSVGYHIPRGGQTQYPVNAPVSLLIHETLRTETLVNGTTFLVRPLAANGTPGAPVAGRLVFAFDDVVTFTPAAPFAPNTTYEVVLPAGGIRDAAGNGMIPYSFRFSTGSTLGAGNEPPAILSLTTSAHPAPVGGAVNLLFAANDREGSAVTYRVDFGDGGNSGWISSGSVPHTYATAGHYDVVLEARDASGATSLRALTVTVQTPPSGPAPTQSAPISLQASGGFSWVVNPDNDSVTRVAANGTIMEVLLGAGSHPRGVAVDASGNAWVTCEGSDQLRIVSPDGAILNTIAFDYGSAPFGIAFTPNRANALITLYGSGEVVRYSATTRSRTGTLAVGPTPRAIAITGDGTRALVTRFISPDSGGQVYDVALGTNLSLTRTIALREDTVTEDTASSGRGLPNYLAGIAITPSGTRAWVASKQDNVQRGVALSGEDLSSENSVRAIVSEIDLASGAEVFAARRDVDNSDSPSGITFSPLGDYAFVTLQGNNVVAVYDALEDAAALGAVPVQARFETGFAPQGAVFDPGTQRLLVHDFMSRGVRRIEMAGYLAGTTRNVTAGFVKTVGSEMLATNVFTGKRIFYNASDTGGPLGANRMSGSGYFSCATCHVDGGADGRTWDFSGRGEGLRNTTDLRGRNGIGHGRVHWSANFDEIQDFENDIRNAFGGAGFLSDADFAATSNPLGAPKRGLSYELDALAAYVKSLGASSLPRSSFRNADGQRSAAAQRGATVFASQGCPTCHSGSILTDRTIHDVGTLSTTSGKRLGATLPGIDTPTLLAVASSPPYLHDGSAATLEDVFSRAGSVSLQAESANLLGGATTILAAYGGSYRGGSAVRFGTTSELVRWQQVDGGAGGPATLTLRYSALYGTRPGVVRVNGVSIPVSLPVTPNDPAWFPTAFRDHSLAVNLNAGATNTIEFQPTGTSPYAAIDELRVVNASAAAATQVHSRVLTLATAQRADLMQHLRELDGSDVPAAPACSNGIDDDDDGMADHDGAGIGAPDPQCVGRPSYDSEQPSCGLGLEVTLLLPALAALRRRSARRSARPAPNDHPPIPFPA